MTCDFFPVARRLAVSLCFLSASAILSASLTAASAQVPVPCPQANSLGPIVVRNNHIFCGDVSPAGFAGGFHSRPGGLDPATIAILPGTTITIPQRPPPAPLTPAGIYNLNGFQITDAITGATAVKTVSTMFPDACGMPNVVAAI